MTARFLRIFLCLALLTARIAVATDLYVDPQGSDTASGGVDAPFATLERARDEIRQLRTTGRLTGKTTVFVRPGTYCLKKTLILGKEDSGSAAAPVVFRSTEAGKSTLIGGQAVGNFAAYRDKILQAPLAIPGKGVAIHQLLCGGARQPLARYPNEQATAVHGGAFAAVDGTVIPMYQEVPGTHTGGPATIRNVHPQNPEAQRVLRYKSEDARPFAHPEELEVFIFPRFNWNNNILPVVSVNRDTRELSLGKPASYEIRPGDRYFIQNAFEELDAPGEWYADRRANILFFWPPEPVDPAKLVVSVPLLKTVIEIGQGAEHITIRGFTIEGSIESAVVLRNASHCTIAGNTIRHVGDLNGDAVSIEGGQENVVAGNDIHHTGRNGIGISGGDQLTLTAASHRAENNYIHHVGVYSKGASGISVRGVGHVIGHNLIHDCPRKAIAFSGNHIVMEYNHVRHTDLETEDTGAIGTGGRNWIDSRGSVIRYNFVHDCVGYGRKNGEWTPHHFNFGLYLDDNTGGVDIVGNIVARSARSVLHLHNSRDNRIENNIFIDGGETQIEYSGWTPAARHWQSCLATMIETYEAAMKSPAWHTMRGMDLHPSQAVLPDNTIMAGNVVRRNIFCYRGAQVKLFRSRNFSSSRNVSDLNLIHHFGQPVLTGQARFGEEMGENLAANAGFEEGTPGQLPRGWKWQIRPPDGITAQLSTSDAADGKASLRLTGGEFIDAKSRAVHPTVVSEAIPCVPGKAYRLTARIKADKAAVKASLGIQSYVADAYFWSKSAPVAATPDWQPYQCEFRIPAAGEPGYHVAMKSMNIRFDHLDASGVLGIDQVMLREAATMDEWQSWQAGGLDTGSVIADPLFVNPEQDDYRLRPESPAFKLGFEPIPVEKIGPYPDELRASWPIREAPGAREQMARWERE